MKDDEHFRQFAGQLQRAIAAYGVVKDPEEYQKQQLTQLLALERQFRDELLADPMGRAVYGEFIRYICDDRRQILDARPFFKERKQVFNNLISPILKARDIDALAQFSISFEFIAFVVEVFDWRTDSKVSQLYEQISKLRQELVVRNMPLAINRARLFFSRTQRSHLSLMDLIQIASKGLMNGIDKYAPENGTDVVPRKFRSTAMGRMTGDFIERYSETLLHFFPSDKRVLYRANKAARKNTVGGGLDYESLAEQVNAKAKDGGHKTDAADVADLMAASSCVSANTIQHSDNNRDGRDVERIDTFAAPEEDRPDTQAEERDVAARMTAAIAGLTIFERKILRLRGVRDHGPL